MRRTLLASLSAPLIVLVCMLATRTAWAQTSTQDLARARTLDQQGAKAYGDGHYNDAIRYFEESLRLGGPPFELSNIAKCYVKLDDPGSAAAVLEKYLAMPSLPVDDREEASQQLDALRKRPSTVTVSSTPSGATVLLDDRPVEGGSATPTSFMVAPGRHVIVLSSPHFQSVQHAFEARYGRAVILDFKLPLAETRPPPDASTFEEKKRFAVRADVGMMLPRYGSVGGSPEPTGLLSASYRFSELGATTFAAGVLLSVTEDSWDNTVPAAPSDPVCAASHDARSATAFSAFATGSAGWDVTQRLRIEALVGAGVAAYSASDLGGDLFVPACHPSPSPRPAVLVGGRLDYAVTRAFRLSALPFALQLQPAFDGTRATPIDASGFWLRVTIAVGLGVDL